SPVPLPAEKILTPGAVTSGLSQLSPVRGPPDVKSAGARYPGVDRVMLLSVALRSSAASSLGPALDGTPRNGMVALTCSPVSGLSVIGPSKGGRLSTLLTIST